MDVDVLKGAYKASGGTNGDCRTETTGTRKAEQKAVVQEDEVPSTTQEPWHFPEEVSSEHGQEGSQRGQPTVRGTRAYTHPGGRAGMGS